MEIYCETCVCMSYSNRQSDARISMVPWHRNLGAMSGHLTCYSNSQSDARISILPWHGSYDRPVFTV